VDPQIAVPELELVQVHFHAGSRYRRRKPTRRVFNTPAWARKMGGMQRLL
jgi:hypothetical protein